ncbi:MAG: hypothetical protein ACREJD_05800 [Phycisphaerales bacterium]
MTQSETTGSEQQRTFTDAMAEGVQANLQSAGGSEAAFMVQVHPVESNGRMGGMMRNVRWTEFDEIAVCEGLPSGSYAAVLRLPGRVNKWLARFDFVVRAKPMASVPASFSPAPQPMPSPLPVPGSDPTLMMTKMFDMNMTLLSKLAEVSAVKATQVTTPVDPIAQVGTMIQAVKTLRELDPRAKAESASMLPMIESIVGNVAPLFEKTLDRIFAARSQPQSHRRSAPAQQSRPSQVSRPDVVVEQPIASVPLAEDLTPEKAAHLVAVVLRIGAKSTSQDIDTYAGMCYDTLEAAGILQMCMASPESLADAVMREAPDLVPHALFLRNVEEELRELFATNRTGVGEADDTNGSGQDETDDGLVDVIGRVGTPDDPKGAA